MAAKPSAATENVELEPSVKEAVAERLRQLIHDIEGQEATQVKRDEEVREARARLDKLKAEQAEIEAFLARN